jgi:hypothetical protein
MKCVLFLNEIGGGGGGGGKPLFVKKTTKCVRNSNSNNLFPNTLVYGHIHLVK